MRIDEKQNKKQKGVGGAVGKVVESSRTQRVMEKGPLGRRGLHNLGLHLFVVPMDG